MLAVPECADSSSSPVSHSYPSVFTAGNRFLVMQPFGYVVPSIYWSLSCSPCASSAKQRSSRQLMGQPERFSIISVTHCTSFTFSLPSFKHKETQKVEVILIWWNFGNTYYVMLHCITKAKELVPQINKCSSRPTSLCFSKGMSSW